jgi:hypothetical protein
MGHFKFPQVLSVLLLAVISTFGQLTGKSVYQQISSFKLTGGKADVTNLVLKRDRVEMSFTGTFYFAEPIGGFVTGAVFIGRGSLKAEVPPGEFEKANARRFIKSNVLDSDFSSAVLRFSDDTFNIIGRNVVYVSAPPEAQGLAADVDARIRKETGANISARLTSSLMNQEDPGVFFATFEGGNRGRFSYIFDPQERIPAQNFEINGGEKGIIYAYKESNDDYDVWMAFYGLDDYARNRVSYSDVNDLVDVSNYSMEVDLREPKKRLGLRTKLKFTALKNGVKVIPFSIGEDLGAWDHIRLKKQMRVSEVRLSGSPIEFEQEDWEAGFAVFLPEPLKQHQEAEIEITAEGDFLRQAVSVDDCSYPLSNDSWFPRHGYLDRATFDMTFLHDKKLKVAAIGERESEAPSPEDKNVTVTKYKMSEPVPLATFALGPWVRHEDSIKWEDGRTPTPLEFNSLSGSQIALKEDFMLAELNNCIRFFNLLFGNYPYSRYSATFHPYGFGQGFPTMLMIPAADHTSKYVFAFIAHETAHQWWGNIVAWRSYRDQWLSEGFAEYSSLLYTQRRQNVKAVNNMVEDMRRTLKEPPYTETGPGKGRLVDVGPIVLGHRLESRKTYGSYTTLIYNKGALVLRMLHYLFTDPDTGNGQAFFDMMKDFVERYRNKAASTDDFRRVANEHFATAPIAKRLGLTNLDWFFNQWVYHAELPSYSLEYKIQNQPDGGAVISGTVYQEGAPEDWLMPLPLALDFGGGKSAVATVYARGPEARFQLKLPTSPAKVELDPYHWILSDKTSTR